MSLNVTAMDFRQYDNAIGRFNCIDLLAENSVNLTPYHFGNNNPNYWVDPSGLEASLSQIIDDFWRLSGSGSTTWTNDGGGFWSTEGSSGGAGPGSGYYNSSNGSFTAYGSGASGGGAGGGGTGGGVNSSYVINNGSGNMLNEIVIVRNSTSSNANVGNIQTAGYFTGTGGNAYDAFNLGISFYGLTAAAIQSRLLADRNFYQNKGTQTALKNIAKNITPSLNKIKGVSTTLGIASTLMTVGKIAYDYKNGKDITASNVFDVSLSVALTFVAVSNPVGLVGLGVYGLLDAGGAFDGIKSSLGGDNVVVESPY